MSGQAVPSATRPASTRHNVIIVVADGLRRGSVTPDVMPAFSKLRADGVDFRNSHSSFPTFTTANASVIATGHGIGDTGDYSNVIYPGVWLTKPEAPPGGGYLMPFLESDPVLANMNAVFNGNYLGETTLLTAARAQGYNTASVGKLGPTAIQQIGDVSWDTDGHLSMGDAVIIDDSTGSTDGLPLPTDLVEAMQKADLPAEAPLRSNGYGVSSQSNNGFNGDAQTPGTLEANRVQLQWFVDVTTKVLLPQFAASPKPFALLFWSRDPDGTQHNEGDSLQNLTPGINGPTSERSLRNVDHDLKQILDWLDAHPEIKANTDVLVTSDHGFATVSRREIAADGAMTAEPSAALNYNLVGKEKPEPQGTLPIGFLALDLGVRSHLRIFDANDRATVGGSVYTELTIGGEKSDHPSQGNALLGDTITHVDGSDAQVLLASNGGSDLLYVPGGNASIVHQMLATLTQLDYVGGLFVDDKYCAKKTDCAGALPLSAVGMVGSSKVPRPAIVVTFKVFHLKGGDLQTAGQVSDTNLQEGQGMHGGFGRDQTFNNMAAVGPDFKQSFTDEAPMGNIDIAPTLAHIMGIKLAAVGKLRGRVLEEALAGGPTPKTGVSKVSLSTPATGGVTTRLEWQTYGGVEYYDDACIVLKSAEKACD